MLMVICALFYTGLFESLHVLKCEFEKDMILRFSLSFFLFLT